MNNETNVPTPDPAEEIAIQFSRLAWSTLTAAIRHDPDWKARLGRPAAYMVRQIESVAHVDNVPPPSFDSREFVRSKIPDVLKALMEELKTAKSKTAKLRSLRMLRRIKKACKRAAK